MSAIDLDELERLALAATPGDWTVTDGGDASNVRGIKAGKRFVVDTGCGCCQVADFKGEDAAFIAAASPSTMLALIALVREVRA